MRTKNSIRNIYISVLTQIIIIFLGFLSRKVFLDNLGTEYLGVNGVLSNVLSMLSLVEGGIGASIVYNLYKPLAEDDKSRVTALVQLYKRLYGILAILVFILSLSLYPFLGILMSESKGVPFIGIVYFIFVSKNVISYFNAHKWSLITADQKGYIIAKYNLLFNVITIICKIIVLQITKNYILFLLIEVIIFSVQNIWNGKIVNKRYSYIKTKEKYSIDTATKNQLIKNVKAMFLHNIGNYCVFGTDNILIAAFINIKTVGLYSNYTMVISQLTTLMSNILNGIGASVGNLIVTESKEKTYKVFNITCMINFWIYSIVTITLYNLLEPFINWWLGEGLLLQRIVLLVILINFYITGLRTSVGIFKTRAGIFVSDKYMPLLEAVINLGVSIILVNYIGLAGIFLGTTISSISVPIWVQAKLVYNKVFDKSVIEYFIKYIFYAFLTIVVGFITSYLCDFLVSEGDFSSLVYKGIICITVPNIIYVVLFFKTEEFQYLWDKAKSIVAKLNRLRVDSTQ